MKYCSSCGKENDDAMEMCDECDSLSFQYNRPKIKPNQKVRAITLAETTAENTFFSIVRDDAENIKSAFSSCLAVVFLRMFFALFITTVSAFSAVYFHTLQSFVSNYYVFNIMLFAELILVAAIASFLDELSVASAKALFFLYAVMNGLTLSAVFLVYNLGDIYSAFGVAALMFAVMACYGILTKRDMSSIGNICFMGLIGIILASLLNFLLKSELMGYIVCYVGVFVFIGLTAYDTQNIKKMLEEAENNKKKETIEKIAVIGALSLYLDFINLFLKILSLLGRKK